MSIERLASCCPLPRQLMSSDCCDCLWQLTRQGLHNMITFMTDQAISFANERVQRIVHSNPHYLHVRKYSEQAKLLSDSQNMCPLTPITCVRRSAQRAVRAACGFGVRHAACAQSVLRDCCTAGVRLGKGVYRSAAEVHSALPGRSAAPPGSER